MEAFLTAIFVLVEISILAIVALIVAGLYWGGSIYFYRRFTSTDGARRYWASWPLQFGGVAVLAAILQYGVSLAFPMFLILPPVMLFALSFATNFTVGFQAVEVALAVSTISFLSALLLTKRLRPVALGLSGAIFLVTFSIAVEYLSQSSMCRSARSLGVDIFDRLSFRQSVRETNDGFSNYHHASFHIDDQLYGWSYRKNSFEPLDSDALPDSGEAFSCR